MIIFLVRFSGHTQNRKELRKAKPRVWHWASSSLRGNYMS